MIFGLKAQDKFCRSIKPLCLHLSSNTSTACLQQILVSHATAKTLKPRRSFALRPFSCGGFERKLL